MRKRQRKKRRVGEFQELGLEVRFRLNDDVSDSAAGAFCDEFISGAIEGRRLICGGGCGRQWDIFVSRERRGSATEEDRAAITAWLDRRPDVETVHIGPLADAWYSA